MVDEGEGVSKCDMHMAKAVSAACTSCGKGICTVCMQQAGGSRLCYDCRNRKGKRLKFAAVAFAIVLAGGAFALHSNRPLTSAAVAPAVADPEIQRLQFLIQQEPCDVARNLKLLEGLVTIGDNRAALTAGDRFFTACGDAPRLRWVTHEAHRRLSEWDGAVKEASRLIESNRYDTDFWWWRGVDYERLGKLPEAESDFRMAFSLCVACLSTVSLADVLEKSNRPCEAIFPLQQFEREVPNANHELLSRRIDLLANSGACETYLGTGNATIAVGARRHAETQVRIGGRNAGTFLVDTGASVVVIPETDADALGIKGPFTEIVVKTANGFTRARLGFADSVEVGGLRTSHVEVALVGGSDVSRLLGMSFLGRFDLEYGKRQLVIKARRPGSGVD